MSEKFANIVIKIEANFKLIPYAGKEHDYLQEVLPEIELMVLERCNQLLRTP